MTRPIELLLIAAAGAMAIDWQLAKLATAIQGWGA